MPRPIPHSRDFVEAAFMSASSLADIMDTLECSRATVYNLAKRYGLALPPTTGVRGGRRVDRRWAGRGIDFRKHRS